MCSAACNRSFAREHAVYHSLRGPAVSVDLSVASDENLSCALITELVHFMAGRAGNPVEQD